MTVAWQAAGTFQNGGAVQLTVPWPTHLPGDHGFLAVQSNVNVGLLTANGFVEVTDSPQATTGIGLQVYHCLATSSSMSSPVTNTGSNNISGVIVTVRGGSADATPWDVTAGGTGGLSSAISTPSDTTTIGDCLILYFIARSGDAAGANASGEADSNVTNLAERVDDGTATGNGGGLVIYSANKVTAGAIGPLTATLATSSSKGYVVLALKSGVLLAASTNINAAVGRSNTY